MDTKKIIKQGPRLTTNPSTLSIGQYNSYGFNNICKKDLYCDNFDCFYRCNINRENNYLSTMLNFYY